jgi:hypothetical protein
VIKRKISGDSKLVSGRHTKCEDASLWLVDAMIYPFGGNAPLPNPDLPPDIRRDYEEARAIS